MISELYNIYVVQYYVALLCRKRQHPVREQYIQYIAKALGELLGYASFVSLWDAA